MNYINQIVKGKFAIEPIYKRERRYISHNSVTGLYWDGVSFDSTLAANAKYLTEAEKLSLNYTYDNCKFIAASICI